MKQLMLMAFVLTLVSCDSGVGDQVYISDHSLQCQGPGVAIAQSRALLTEVGIEVTASQCAVIENVAFPAVCGGPTGRIHVFNIDEADIDMAINLGFSNAREIDYSSVSCEQ